MRQVDIIQADVQRGVEAAIQCGVSAREFLDLCAELWAAELNDKARRDAATFAARKAR
jgi:hypothetical protein